MSTAGLSGSDDSFWFLCFGFVAVITFFAYIPGVLRFLFGLANAETTKQNLTELFLWLTHVPRTLSIFVRRPAVAKAAVKMLSERKEFTRKVALPKLLRHIIRFKIILVFLFVVLSVRVSYLKLTYDPRAILGVAADADMATIKKVYRSLSIKYHPDRNKSPEARTIYTNIKKAYKALADPDSFEEETKDEPYRVSVALPSWIMDPNKGIINGPVMILALFCLPLYLIYSLKVPRRAVMVRKMTDSTIWVQPEYDYFLQQMGEPQAPSDNKPLESVPLVDESQYDVADYFVRMCHMYVEEQASAAIKQRIAATRTMERLMVTIRQQLQWNLKKQSEIAELRKCGGTQKRLIANFPQTTARQQQTLGELKALREELNQPNIEEELNTDPDDLPGPGAQPTGMPSARDQRRAQKRQQKKEKDGR